MKIKLISKTLSVIFLTVFFSIIASAIANSAMLVSLSLALIILATAIVIAVSLQKVKQIDQSIPVFLNFVNLTMSTGKSFANSFETAIVYQKKSIQPFYQRIYHAIFYLKDEKAAFFFEFQNNFYQKIYLVASQGSQQREKIHNLKQQMIERIEVRRRENSLRAPFLIQTVTFCILFFALAVWHYSCRTSYPEIEILSFGLFLMGLLCSFMIGRPTQKI